MSTIGFIGGGNMAQAIIEGVLKAELYRPGALWVSDVRTERLAELKNRYSNRLIVFDLPPILALDDAIAFTPYTDAMLMVAENGATTKADLQRALEMLKGTPLIGTVLNKSGTMSKYGSYKRS